MTYEKTKIKPTSKSKETMHDLKSISTTKILWFLVKRHKFGLLGTWAVLMTLLNMFPAFPDLVLSLFNK